MIAQAVASVDPLAQAQGAHALPDAADKTDKAARQFEGLLMGLLFQSMRKTVEPSGLLGDTGQSQSTYEYLMDQAVIEKTVNEGRGWGLAERLKADWLRQADPDGRSDRAKTSPESPLKKTHAINISPVS